MSKHGKETTYFDKFVLKKNSIILALNSYKGHFLIGKPNVQNQTCDLRDQLKNPHIDSKTVYMTYERHALYILTN